jgi:integrase
LLAKSIGCGPWDVTGEHLIAWFSGRPWAANTYRARRTTYRAFYAWAVREGHVAVSPAHDVPPGEIPEPLPRPLPDRHWDRALLEATPRERLMVRLAGEHGMRRAEVAQVWPERDMFEDLAGWSLVVHGKGGRDRVVPLLDDVARELRSLGPGWAFPGNDHGHLSPRWVGTLISRLLPEDYTMHKLRHRAGTKWLDETENLAVVQDLLGHADPKTTRAYTRSNAKRMREAVVKGAARRG